VIDNADSDPTIRLANLKVVAKPKRWHNNADGLSDLQLHGFDPRKPDLHSRVGLELDSRFTGDHQFDGLAHKTLLEVELTTLAHRGKGS